LVAFLITRGGVWRGTEGSPKLSFVVEMAEKEYEKAQSDYRSDMQTKNTNIFQYVATIQLLKQRLREQSR